ncbi:MAG TPA: hypothetical protein VFW15_14725, partial [Thermoanaerobaculia bacterium]|nr:hypothetical protein [Thermoanaerobaculia bacterium]
LAIVSPARFALFARSFNRLSSPVAFARRRPEVRRPDAPREAVLRPEAGDFFRAAFRRTPGVLLRVPPADEPLEVEEPP